MARTSPVHYIAPSAISITPNANSSHRDLAVYVARGAKIKVRCPRAGIGIDEDTSTYQEWTLSGRNRRLADTTGTQEYTIYARLPKSGYNKGYLVFAPKTGSGKDKWQYLTLDDDAIYGITSIEGATTSNSDWYVLLGEVSAVENGQRTVTLDTGILGTDQYNDVWVQSPDNLPLRIELGCTIDDEDAGPTPYVYWGQSLVLTASLVEGWTGTDIQRFDHWEIIRDSGDEDADNAWNHPTGEGSYHSLTDGQITLSHARGYGDDFNGAVSATFTVVAMGRPEEGSESQDLVVLKTAVINIHAETVEKYELAMTANIVGYNPMTQTYDPASIVILIRATDQRGDVFELTKGQFDNAGLAVQYAAVGSVDWHALNFTGASNAVATATLTTATVFAAQQSINVRLMRIVETDDGSTAIELTQQTIAFVRNGEDSKVREWIYRLNSNAGYNSTTGTANGQAVSGQTDGVDNCLLTDDFVPTGWSDDPTGVSQPGDVEWESWRDYDDENHRWGVFHTPVIHNRYAGDGNGISSVTRTYARSTQSTSTNDTTAPTGIDTSVGTNGWAATSPAVTEAYPYLWAKEVVVYTNETQTTKYYCIGARGQNGVDAQDIEWVYIRTKTNVAPVISGDGGDNPYTDHNGKIYTSDDHLPKVVAGTGGSLSDIESDNSGNASKLYECTDNPKGMNETWPYEWEIKREKGAADTNGHRSWVPYSGTMTLHNNYAASLLGIDIDNDNDQFGTDSEGKVVTAQTRTTNVTMYYGAQQQVFTSVPTVALKYEDGTSVPSAVAEVGVAVVEGTSNKQYLITVSIKATGSNSAVFGSAGHSGLYVEISGTCAKGGPKSIRFTLEKVMSGAKGQDPVIYQLNPTKKSFSFTRDASNNLVGPNNSTSVSSQINVAKTIGNTTTQLTSAQTGLTYSWGFENESTATQAHSGLAIGTSIEVTNTNAANHTHVWVLLSTGDRETLPITKDGAKGEAGNGIQSVTRTYAISADDHTASDTTAPTIYGSWSTTSPAVTEAYPYLWAKEVVVYTNETQTTKYYCIGARGQNGVDAQDIEWVYIRTKTNVAPVISGDGGDNPYTDHNGKIYTSDDHLPKVVAGTGGSLSDIESDNSGNASKPYECTDDPKGVDDTWKYEWEIKREKGPATNGHRAWTSYSGTMTLHNNLSESALTIDIDNDNDQFGTDSEGKVITAQTRTTNVTILYGSQQQAFTAAPTIALKYEDGTTPASTVAEPSIAVVANTSNKQYLVTVSIKATGSNSAVFGSAGHSGLYVEISGTCAKGGPKSIRFTLEKVMSGAKGVDPEIYLLNPTVKSFSFTRDASNNLVGPNNSTSISSQINVAKTIGNTTTQLTSAQDGLTYSWGFEDESTATQAHSGLAIGTSIEVTNANAASHTHVWVLLSTGDRETLPITKDGAQGTPGTIYQRMYCSNNNGTWSGSLPADYVEGSNGWHIAPTATTPSARYRWVTERRSDDGGTSWGNGWSTPQIDAYLAENGTSISIKGQATAVIPWGESLPASSTNGNLYLMNNDDADSINQYNNGTWDAVAASIGDGYLVDGHLWMKVRETATASSLRWQDAGQIKGEKGDDGWMIAANPANVILTQNLVTTNTFSTATVSFTAKKGSTPATITSINVHTSSTFNVSQVGVTAVVTSPKSNGNNYYTEGSFTVDVNVTDPDNRDTVPFTITVPCYVNLLGKWKQTIEDGVETSIAEKLSYEIFDDEVHTIEQTGEYIRGWAENTSVITKKVNDGKNLLKGVLTGTGWMCADSSDYTRHALTRIEDEWFYVNSGDAYIVSPEVSVEQGKYSLSFDTPYGPSTNVNVQIRKASDVTVLIASGSATSASGTWKSVTFTFSAADDIYVYIASERICHPQLESGEFATEFVASSEEISSSIKQTADKIELKVNDTGIDIENKIINLNAERTVITGNLQARGIDTQEVSGYRIRIEGGMLNVYNRYGFVGLSIGWDDSGDPYLRIAKINSDGTIATDSQGREKAYKLDYNGVNQASATFTSDSFLERILNAAGYSANQINSNTNAATFYLYSAAKNDVTKEYSRKAPSSESYSDTWKYARSQQDNKYLTTNILSTVLNYPTENRIPDGYYIASHGAQNATTLVYSRALYYASGGVVTQVGTVYFKTNSQVGLWCDSDGSNGVQSFDVNRYITPVSRDIELD